jgi:hypothetical protein
MTTPNMLLTVPTVQVTIGPTWAQEINDSLDLIDSHDHSSGKGVQVPTAGININADLTMSGFNLTTARTVAFDDQASTPSNPSDIRIIYSKNGELAYRDAIGQEVIITNNGALGNLAGAITGLVPPASAVYSSVLKTLLFYQDVNKFAKLSISDIQLYEFNNASANAITIKSPAAIAAPYTITMLPALPGSTQALTIDSTGQLGTISTGGSNYVESAGASTGYSSTISYIFDPAMQVTIVSTGKPVMFGLKADPQGTTLSYADVQGTSNTFGIEFLFQKDGIDYSSSQQFLQAPNAINLLAKMSYSSFITFDPSPSIGSHTYSLGIKLVSASSSNFWRYRFFAVEL